MRLCVVHVVSGEEDNLTQLQLDLDLEWASICVCPRSFCCRDATIDDSKIRFVSDFNGGTFRPESTQAAERYVRDRLMLLSISLFSPYLPNSLTHFRHHKLCTSGFSLLPSPTAMPSHPVHLPPSKPL